MPKEIASIVLGVLSMVVSFVPIIPLQIVGAAVGVWGFLLGRRARREDYRRDLPATIGQICSGVGVFLCLLAPVLALVSNIILLFTR